MTRLRILWLMTRYWPAIGGAELHSQQIIHQLAAEGHHITVVTHWDTNRTDWLRGTTVLAPQHVHRYHDGESVEVVRIGYSPLRRLRTVLPATAFYAFQRSATKTLAQMLVEDIVRLCGSQWDVIHGVRVGREPLYVAGYQLSRRLQIPFIFTPLHHPRWVGYRYRAYLDLYRQATALIALTDYERSLYERLGIAQDRIQVSGIGPILPATADGARFREAHSIHGPLVLFLGQKYPYKGYEDLAQAAERIWRSAPTVTFAFLGPRTAASRQRFSQNHDRRMIELDTVDVQTKGDALAACDIFCLPSTQESFGGVYTEAWSYSKPVIGCAIPAVRDVITHGSDGLLVPPHDPAALAIALASLLEDGRLRDQLGAAGRLKVAERYTWEVIARQIEMTYQSAIAISNSYQQ